MTKIILLCGFKGSGKTTVAHELVKLVDKIALMESDALIMIKPWKADEHLSDLKMAHATAILKNFLEAGYETIVFPGLIWEQDELDKLLIAFPEYRTNFYIFWLTASNATRYQRRVDRAQLYDEPEQSTKSDAEDIGGFTISSGKSYEISTENRTPQEVAEEILQKLS